MQKCSRTKLKIFTTNGGMCESSWQLLSFRSNLYSHTSCYRTLLWVYDLKCFVPVGMFSLFSLKSPLLIEYTTEVIQGVVWYGSGSHMRHILQDSLYLLIASYQ